MAKTIGLIGGTGAEGRGLAARFALAGLDVFVGSRTAERGRDAAREVGELVGGSLRGGTNLEAAEAGEILVLTLPYAGQQETLTELAEAIGERIVVTAVVPLRFTRARVTMAAVEAGSAAEEARDLLPRARLVGAFHNVSAKHLLDVSEPAEGDVIVCGEDAAAKDAAIELVAAVADLRGLDGGPLANCRYVEGLTALLTNLNRIHKAETHVRIVGV